MKPSLECLGHRVDKERFHPMAAKVKAIKDAPAPTNVTELKSFLGMVNFYGKFLPNLSSTLEPLHELLRKDRRWTWNSRQQKAYQGAKDLLQSSVVSALQPSKEVGSIMRCFPTRRGCNIVARNGRWFRKTDRVCIKNTFEARKRILSTR